MLDQLPIVENTAPLPLAAWVEERILSLRTMDPNTQRERVTAWWAPLDRLQRFVLLKLITGEFRVGVSQTLVVRALAQASGLPVATVAARLMGDWTPNADWFASLSSPESTDVDQSRPYPFFLASPLEEGVSTLGDPADWILEWKWDVIRPAREARRRHPPLVARRRAHHPPLPGNRAAATHLPDGTVLDGEVLAFQIGRPLLGAAAAHRTPEAGRADGSGRAGGVHDLRPARAERQGRQGPAAERAARAADHHLAARRAAAIADRDGQQLEALAEVRTSRACAAVEGLMLKRARPPTAWGASAGTGGSGRSSPTRSTRS